MLIVSGPGTGKTTLFMKRLTSGWVYPDRRVAVATFVRKLVRELGDDIAADTDMSQEDKARAEVMTLHRMARSIVERNHGTQDVCRAPYCAVVTGRWEGMVWGDALSLHDDLQPGWLLVEELHDHLYDANLGPTATVRPLPTRPGNELRSPLGANEQGSRRLFVARSDQHRRGTVEQLKPEGFVARVEATLGQEVEGYLRQVSHQAAKEQEE